MGKKRPLIILTGPTASGKSGLAINLGKRLNGEIVSADSMQIYKGMDIGTAKATLKEQQGVPHHLLNILEPEEEFSVAEYVSLARETINDIQSRGRLPILVGGTTLYIESILENILFFDLPNDYNLRDELTTFADNNGNNALWDKLNELDPKLAENIHPNNRVRVIRGIEVIKTSGKPLSYWQKLSRSEPSPYDTLLFGLSYKDREILYNRINTRVDEMIANGLVDETKELYKRELSITARQAIGYKELRGAIEGRESLDDGVALLKQETRRYAKRQLTWMRSREDLIWLNRDSYTSDDDLINDVEQKAKDFLI